MRRLITAFLVIGGLTLVPTAVAANATLFGGASTSGGIVTLVSNTGDASATNDASGAAFTGTGVTTFSSITTLSTEFNVTDDDCKAGSPRFQIRVQTPSGEKNVFVYLGPAPSFTGCPHNTWIASGNLIGSADGRFDTSQVQAGTQVSTYAQALALVGSLHVTAISLVVDSGFAFDDKEQTVTVRNVRVNGNTFFAPETTPPSQPAPHHDPAHVCQTLRADMGTNAFHAAFGTNHNHANAFGKCVSHMTHLKSDEARAAAMARLDRAADRCVATVKAKATAKTKHAAKLQVKLRVCLRNAL